MPTLKSAPNPAQFANAWTRNFAAAVRAVGGKDGRLSRSEAAKIAKLGGPLAQYADNAINYLDKTGQKTVKIDKIIGKGHNYAYAVADKVAGDNKRVSLVEARLLPDDIRGDFFALRGKADPDAKLTGAKLVDALDAACVTPNGDKLTYTSESDYEVVPVTLDASEITADNALDVLRQVITDNDYFDYELADDKKLEDFLTVEISKPQLTTWDDVRKETDDWYKNLEAGFAQVADVLHDNVTDLVLVRIGPKNDDGSMATDDGLYVEAILGKTADGKLAGVHYGSVET